MSMNLAVFIDLSKCKEVKEALSMQS